MLNPIYSNQFKKDFKLCQKRGYKLEKIKEIMLDLENEIPLNPKLREHQLQGNYKNCLECHIEPDWLLIYSKDEVKQELYFIRTGTHSDLF